MQEGDIQVGNVRLLQAQDLRELHEELPACQEDKPPRDLQGLLVQHEAQEGLQEQQRHDAGRR
jgi:hypothetical protein